MLREGSEVTYIDVTLREGSDVTYRIDVTLREGSEVTYIADAREGSELTYIVDAIRYARSCVHSWCCVNRRFKSCVQDFGPTSKAPIGDGIWIRTTWSQSSERVVSNVRGNTLNEFPSDELKHTEWSQRHLQLTWFCNILQVFFLHETSMGLWCRHDFAIFVGRYSFSFRWDVL